VDTATGADLSLDGGPPRKVSLRAGTSVLRFPKQRVSRLRLTLTKVVGPGSQVRISGIDAGGARIPQASGSSRLRGCVAMGTIDGQPLEVAVDGTLNQLSRGQDLPLRACPGHPLRLGAGDHRLQTSPGWLVDLLDLASRPAGGAARAGADQPTDQAQATTAPRVTLTSSSATRTTLTTEAAQGPYYLVLGQGYDSRWQATLDGQPLGPPRVLDGYSVGWRIADRGEHRIAVEFQPQRWASASLAASLASLALVVALVFVPRRRRGPTARPDPAPLAPPPPARALEDPAEGGAAP
jgi:arabinofuranan 3-O-arabinosyltransferase